MEIITGKSGTPHISSADDGRRIAGTVGPGSYVLPLGGRLKPTLVDANTVSIASGDALIQGRHVSVPSPETVKIANGTQGRKRIDYICMRYARDVAGSRPTLIETAELAVLKGVPSTSPAPPSVPAGSILAGDATATVPIASVELDGLTVGTPSLLLPELVPLAELWDSVSLAPVKVSPASGVPSDAVLVARSGSVVYVKVVGNLGVKGGVWDGIALASGLPKPSVSEAYNAGIAQSLTSPLLLRVDWNGNLSIRGTGTTAWNGGWFFGSLTYLA